MGAMQASDVMLDELKKFVRRHRDIIPSVGVLLAFFASCNGREIESMQDAEHILGCCRCRERLAVRREAIEIEQRMRANRRSQ
jgi:hypothetical protein